VTSRAAVAAVYRELGARGFTPGSAGNVSVRARGGMLITPSGVAADAVTARGIVRVADDGAAGGGVPSSEAPMHLAIYRAFPAAGAIIHTHAEAATALACLGQPIPAFHYMVVAFGGADIPCAPYVTFGTPELARVAVAALAGRRACLLANHGVIVHAPDLAAALTDAIVLESLARQYLLARAAGPVRVLTVAEVAAATRRFASYRGGGAGSRTSTVRWDSAPIPPSRA
jgi:L-fuculose-phosphate aldolase